MSVKSQELREQRAKLVTDAQALLREGTLTLERRAKFDLMMEDQEKLAYQIRTEEEAEQRAQAVTEGKRVVDAYGARFETKAEREYRMIWDKYARFGAEELEPQERKLLREHRDTDASGQAAGTQSISYTAGIAGGYFVPAGFVYDVEQALKYFCPLMDGGIVKVLETATGAVLPYPTGNDVNNLASLIGENTQVSETPVTLGVVNFNAYKYTTNVIRVSIELLQDSAFNLDDYLAQRFAERLGRKWELDFTKGTGSAQPTGIVTAVLGSGAVPITAVGSNANDGSGSTGSNSIGYGDLVNLEHAVDPAYRSNGKFMFHDQTLKFLKTLLDKYGRPLWLPGIAVNAPDTILGHPYVINQSMDQIGSKTNVVLFGDLSKFIIRKVKDLSILRLVERYADYGQIGFLGFARADSNLVDAGTHPIQLLQMHS